MEPGGPMALDDEPAPTRSRRARLRLRGSAEVAFAPIRLERHAGMVSASAVGMKPAALSWQGRKQEELACPCPCPTVISIV